ncbi:MAG: hypothetical protein JO267_05550 [Alphaproteobacteria bacterium]|nr:hypothetical protein [Alphaproteobacteria bacterium]
MRKTIFLQWVEQADARHLCEETALLRPEPILVPGPTRRLAGAVVRFAGLSLSVLRISRRAHGRSLDAAASVAPFQPGRRDGSFGEPGLC